MRRDSGPLFFVDSDAKHRGPIPRERALIPRHLRPKLVSKLHGIVREPENRILPGK